MYDSLFLVSKIAHIICFFVDKMLKAWGYNEKKTEIKYMNINKNM
jgi:hypothetical protein